MQPADLRQAIIPDSGLLAVMKGDDDRPADQEVLKNYIKNLEQALQAGISIAEILATMPSLFRKQLSLRLLGMAHRN